MKTIRILCLALLIVGCQKEQEAQSLPLFIEGEPEVFREDVLSTGLLPFEFDEKRLPIKGKTTEEELVKLINQPIYQRMTFLKPQKKRFPGSRREFEFDRLYHWRRIFNVKMQGEGFVGYEAKEHLFLTVFCLNGRVVDFWITHNVRDPRPGANWVRGEFHSAPLLSDENNEFWPGAPQDTPLYLKQRDPEAVNRYHRKK